MGRVTNENRVHRARVQPKIQPKPKKIEVQDKKPSRNANTKRNETQSYANQQKARLNQTLDKKNERNNSLLNGGTAGSMAAQFSQRESQVRGSGNITVTNKELSYDYNTHQFVRNDNPNTPDFVNKVRSDFNMLAPGTKVIGRPDSPLGGFIWDSRQGKDTAAIIKPAPLGERTSGHDAGYRLVDQLKNNPNTIAISKYPTSDNAFAAPRDPSSSRGTVANPNAGSSVDVSYNPDAVLDLPVRNTAGQLENAPTSAAVILGHELNHASHMQRGTNDPISGDGGKSNIFQVDGQNFREADNTSITLREEFRTVGTDNYNYGSEPSENRLRSETGDPNRRVSYQRQETHNPISSTEAFVGNTQNSLRNTGDAVIDGVKGSRNSALIGAGFGAVTAIAQGKDTQGVVTDAAVGAGSGVTEEVVERLVNGPRAATTGMTSSANQAARATMKGAAVAGAITNTAFAVHDQWNNLQDDTMRSQAVGTIAGEAVVGAASGAAGAYAGAMAGAAIGSIVPGVGTVIGGVAGFAVGAAAGYLADKGLRGIGVDKLVGTAVTATYDAVSNTANAIGEGAKDLVGGAVGKLSSVFSW